MKFTKIGGIDFETTRTKHADGCINRHNSYWTYDDINDAYSRPSYEKVRVFEGWKDWADSCDYVRYMRITSVNSFAFTLGALYVEPDTNRVLGYIQITRDHNRLMLRK